VPQLFSEDSNLTYKIGRLAEVDSVMEDVSYHRDANAMGPKYALTCTAASPCIDA
jgi:hypothetical protein